MKKRFISMLIILCTVLCLFPAMVQAEEELPDYSSTITSKLSDGELAPDESKVNPVDPPMTETPVTDPPKNDTPIVDPPKSDTPKNTADQRYGISLTPAENKTFTAVEVGYKKQEVHSVKLGEYTVNVTK